MAIREHRRIPFHRSFIELTLSIDQPRRCTRRTASAASAGASDAAPAEKTAEEPPAPPAAQPATKATASEAPKPHSARSVHEGEPGTPAHQRPARRVGEAPVSHRASKQDIRWLEAAEKNPKKPEAYRVAAAILRAEQGFAHANIPDAIKRFEKLLKVHPERWRTCSSCAWANKP